MGGPLVGSRWSLVVGGVPTMARGRGLALFTTRSCEEPRGAVAVTNDDHGG